MSIIFYIFPWVICFRAKIHLLRYLTALSYLGVFTHTHTHTHREHGKKKKAKLQLRSVVSLGLC